MSKMWKRAIPSALTLLVLAACGGGGGGDSGPVVAVDVSPAPAVTLTRNLTCSSGDKCDLRMYQIMVEAFIDGDPAHDYNAGYGTSHHKGDLRGIINSLNYIKSLGVNAVWLTPIFETTSLGSGNDDKLDATGYYASNYFKVDPKFGTEADLKELVDKAHSLGLYVFLDGVFGHYKSNLAASPAGLRPKNGDCIGSDGSTYKPGATQGCADFSAPQTKAFFKEVATYWIKNFKIDGWRLDQAYQVPTGDWGWLRGWVEHASSQVTYIDAKGQTVNPPAHMVAEVWSSEYQIRDRAYGSNASPALLSAFDFPLRYTLVQTLAGEEWGPSNGKMNLPASTLASGYNSNNVYPTHAAPNLMIGNHDLVRFGDLIQRANLGEPSQDVYWDRHKAAFSFLAAHSGPITIYYGDEIGQELAGFDDRVADNVCAAQGLCDDHVSRTSGIVEGQATVFGDPVTVLNTRQADLKNHLAKLMKFRQDNPALSIGSRIHVRSDASVYIDRKEAGTNRVLYVLNAKPGVQTVSVNASEVANATTLIDLDSGDTVTAVGGVFTFNVPSLSARFLKY